MTVIILLLFTFNNFIQSNWDTIRWPAFLVIIMLALFAKNTRTPTEGRFRINRIIEENKWVKIYLTIYTAIIIICSFYVIYNNVKLNGDARILFLAIGLLILPVILIEQKEAFLNAGKKSNK